MSKHITGLTVALLALLAFQADAQRRSDTTIKGTTLEVYQVYEPEMKPIQKPNYTAAPPPANREPVPQQYEVPQQTLLYSYPALPLRPLALGKDTGSLPPQNYVLLGGGNLSTILAEAGLGNLHGDNWKANVSARYLSQQGAQENQLFRDFFLSGDGTVQVGTNVVEAGLDVGRKVYGRYGYDHDVLRYDRDSVRMKYDHAGLSLGMYNTEPGPWGIAYHPTFQFMAWDGAQGHETDLNLYAPATKFLDSSFSLGLALNLRLAWNSLASLPDPAQSSHVFQLTPFADFHREGFSIHAAVSPTWSQGAELLWLPDIRLRYQFWNDRLGIALGWKADRVQNTLQQLSIVNPYLFPGDFDIHQTTRHEVFGRFDLAVGNHLSIWGNASWQQNDVLPLYITRPGSDGKDLSLIYDDDVRAICWGGGLRYQLGEYLAIGAEGQWSNYYQQAYLRHPYGLPAVRLRGNIYWTPARGLSLSSYMEVLDEIWALNAVGQDVHLRGVFDFGAALEYNFVSKLSVFLRAENLLGRHNERWLDYPSFGFNIYGGIRFRF